MLVPFCSTWFSSCWMEYIWSWEAILNKKITFIISCVYYILVGFKVQRGWELKGIKKVWIEKAKEQRLEIYIMCIIKVTKLFYQRAPWIVRCFGHKHPIASSFCNIGALFRTSLWTVSTQLTTMVSYGIWIKPKKKSHPCVIHVPSTLHDVPRSHWWSAFDPWCLTQV